MRNTEKTNNVETFCQNVSTKNVSTKNISRKGKNAFTLVELIIVITILAILATIGFMSYQSYTRDARDTNRTTTLKTLSDGLTIYKAKNSSYPMPDSPVTISLSGTAISYEGQAGATVLSSIKSSDAKDPLDNNYYTYLINANKSSFQLMGYLENSVAYSHLPLGEGLGVRAQQTYARDYTTRIPKTQGDILGILLDSTTNTPISTPIDLFLSQSGTIYKAVITDKVIKTLNGAGLGGGLQMLSIKGGKMRAPSNCEAGYIGVPGNPDFMQPGFCVAKYEMKKVSGVATSQASGNLWIRITQPQAITACNNLGAGYHLITNNEWMTIARNIEANSQNWADGIVGSLVGSGGGLYRGNVGLYDSVSCGSGAALDGNTAGSGCVNSSGRNKRMHILSNGNEIWDISGNLREHVNGTNYISHATGEVAYGNACSTYGRHSWNETADDYASCSFTYTTPTFYSESNYGPLGNYNAYNGVGRIYSSTNTNNTNNSSNRTFIRGGSYNASNAGGVFSLYLDNDSNSNDGATGFRCAK